MTQFKLTDLCDQNNQKELYNLLFDNCYVSSISGERVAQVITSIADSNFREEIPISKYISGTVTICDGFFSHKITFHSTGLDIQKVAKNNAGSKD